MDAPPLSPGARRRRCSQEHAFVLTMGAGTRVYGYCRRFISVDTDGTGRLDMGEHRTMFCFCVLSRRYVCGHALLQLPVAGQRRGGSAIHTARSVRHTRFCMFVLAGPRSQCFRKLFK